MIYHDKFNLTFVYKHTNAEKESALDACFKLLILK